MTEPCEVCRQASCTSLDGKRLCANHFNERAAIKTSYITRIEKQRDQLLEAAKALITGFHRCEDHNDVLWAKRLQALEQAIQDVEQEKNSHE